MRPLSRLLATVTVVLAVSVTLTLAQRGALPPDQVTQRLAAERELQELAVVDRKVMMPMRDGIRLASRPSHSWTGRSRTPRSRCLPLDDQIPDVVQRILGQDQQVSLLARLDRADLVVQAHQAGRVAGHHL